MPNKVDLEGILIDHVNHLRMVVSAWVTDTDGVKHRLGHLPKEGWFCNCDRATRCPLIRRIRTIVPEMKK